MKYHYTAREKDGTVRQGSLMAQNWGAAVAALRVQGVVPLSLVEGDAKTMRNSRSLLHSMSRIVVGVAVVLVLIAASLLLVNRSQPEKVGATSSKVEPVPGKSERVKVVSTGTRAGYIVPVSAVTSIPFVTQDPSGSGVADVSTSQPAVQAQAEGGVINVRPPRPPRRPGVRILDQDGKEINKPRPEFKTQTDRLLWAVLNSKGVRMIPLAPMLTEFDFAKALREKVEIMPDDTPDDIANKEDIERLKQEINGMRQEGHKLVDVIHMLQNESNAVFEYRRGLQNTLFTLVKEGKLEEAAIYQKFANQELATAKASPIYVPEILVEAGKKIAAELGN
jgi:hypothetical protein